MTAPVRRRQGARKWVAVALAALPLLAPAYAAAQSRSDFRTAPHGLRGWLVRTPVPGQGDLPYRLVITRHGSHLHTFSGDTFLWHWLFWNDGREVVFESGPLHFSMSCIRADVQSGKELERVDCWKQVTKNDPAWVQALEKPQP